MATSGKILGDTYIPKFAKNYNDLSWYERDFISYIDWLKYKQMMSNPDDCFSKQKVVNFDIIHHECRGGPIQKSYKEYKTVKESDFFYYSDNEKQNLFLQLLEILKGTIYGYNGI